MIRMAQTWEKLCSVPGYTSRSFFSIKLNTTRLMLSSELFSSKPKEGLPTSELQTS